MTIYTVATEKQVYEKSGIRNIFFFIFIPYTDIFKQKELRKNDTVILMNVSA